MPAPKSKFAATETEMYEVGRSGWQSCTDDLAQFTALKGFYLGPFITTKIAAIDAAENLPDDQVRGADHEIKHGNMNTQAGTCIDLWLQLERYIDTAYPDPVTKKARDEESGSLKYPEAADHNWEQLKSMLLDGKNFIANHTSDLTANQNMPVGFSATYNGALTTFLPMLTAFIDAEQVAHTGTSAKVTANNAVYDDLIKMFKDGRFIFRHNPTKAANYNFAHVKRMISTPGAAGLKVTIVADVTFVPLAGTTAMMQQQGKPAVTLITDAEGIADFNGLEAGTYTLTVTLANYQTYTAQVKIKTGVHSRKKITLVHN